MSKEYQKNSKKATKTPNASKQSEREAKIKELDKKIKECWKASLNSNLTGYEKTEIQKKLDKYEAEYSILDKKTFESFKAFYPALAQLAVGFEPTFTLSEEAKNYIIQGMTITEYLSTNCFNGDGKELYKYFGEIRTGAIRWLKEKVEQEFEVEFSEFINDFITSKTQGKKKRKLNYPVSIEKYLQYFSVFEKILFQDEYSAVIDGAGTKEQNIDKDTLKKKYSLTDREIEVLELIIQGYRNRDIEGALFITSDTVESHVASVLKKVGVKQRGQVITKIFNIPEIR